MQSLYEIKQEYLDALNNLQVDEETGEIIGFEALDEAEGNLNDKIEAVALYVKDQEAFTAAMKAEYKALKSRIDTAERKVERVKQYLTSSMTAVGKENFESPKCKISFRRSIQTVILDESLIPNEYFDLKVDQKVSLSRIKEALKQDIPVAGAALQENQNIQIK